MTDTTTAVDNAAVDNAAADTTASTVDPTDGGPDQVEVRRNGALAAVVGSLAAVVAAAYLARAATSGSWVDWLVALSIGAVALVHGAAVLDARTPLLVADRTGIRLRLGRSWHGLLWADLEEVEHAPRRSLLRDGRLVAFPADPEAALATLDPAARRQAAIAERVHGAPFAVPLGVTTLVSGAPDGLTAALLALAPDPELVVEVVPADPQPVDHLDGEPWAVSETSAATAPAEGGNQDDQDDQDDQDTGAVGAVDETSDDTVVRPNPFRRAARAAVAARAARPPGRGSADLAP
ncbi:MAG: hypothetical protein LH468_02830, partial [Nocardioides sp.]|nr:hypothetical protein [Nocardioides sp.]